MGTRPLDMPFYRPIAREAEEGTEGEEGEQRAGHTPVRSHTPTYISMAALVMTKATSSHRQSA